MYNTFIEYNAFYIYIYIYITCAASTTQWRHTQQRIRAWPSECRARQASRGVSSRRWHGATAEGTAWRSSARWAHRAVWTARGRLRWDNGAVAATWKMCQAWWPYCLISTCHRVPEWHLLQITFWVCADVAPQRLRDRTGGRWPRSSCERRHSAHRRDRAARTAQCSRAHSVSGGGRVSVRVRAI